MDNCMIGISLRIKSGKIRRNLFLVFGILIYEAPE